MLERPPCQSAQLCHHVVARSEQLHIEFDMAHGLRPLASTHPRRHRHKWGERYRFGDVNLGNVWGEKANNLGHGSNLETGSDTDEQVGLLAVVMHEPLVEGVGQLLAKEGDIWLFLVDETDFYALEGGRAWLPS